MNKIARSLEDITIEAKTIYNRMEKDYARWGELMLEAKKLVPRGEWMKYLEINFPIVSQRQANRYMELARDETKTLASITNPKPNWSDQTNSLTRQVPHISQPSRQ